MGKRVGIVFTAWGQALKVLLHHHRQAGRAVVLNVGQADLGANGPSAALGVGERDRDTNLCPGRLDPRGDVVDFTERHDVVEDALAEVNALCHLPLAREPLDLGAREPQPHTVSTHP